jgi:glycerate 2-kinase
MVAADPVDRRRLALDLFEHGLRAVAPGPAVRAALDGHALASAEGIRVAALGKAAVDMFLGAHAILGERIASSLIATPVEVQSHQLDAVVLADQIIVGGHPLPDEGSLAAGEALVEFASGRSGPLLVLVSGGSSACVEVPRPGVDLTVLREVNRRLLQEELDISVVNAVRSAYSKIKDGGLLRWADPEKTWLFAISDVPTDDPCIIGSGLLHADPTRRANAESLSAALGLAQPLRMSGVDTALPVGRTKLLLSGRDAVRAMASRAATMAHSVRLLEQRVEGPTAQAGLALAEKIIDGERIILGCGECVVHLPANPGRGGRCQQLALSAAKRLSGDGGVLLAAGSDGTDGPDGAAGALIDGGTWLRIQDAGVDAAGSLTGADSGTALAASGDLIDTGPTGTNVGDLFVGIPGKVEGL